MESEPDQSQQIAMDSFQLPFFPNKLMATSSPLLANEITAHFPYHFPPYQITQQVQQQQQLMKQDRQLQIFWANQLQEIKATADFKNHNLPLARIKKIMKSDEDVKMIAAETPVLFSRACEMFILELTYRSWSQAEHNKRRTLQKSDICSAITKYPMFDFLIDIVPMEEVSDAGVLMMPESEEVLSEPFHCFYDPSKFGSLMMDMRPPEMVPHSLSFAQHQQEHNAPVNPTNSTSNVSE